MIDQLQVESRRQDRAPRLELSERSAPMLHADRSRLMILMTVAALTLCGGGAYTQDEDQPINDLP